MDTYKLPEVDPDPAVFFFIRQEGPDPDQKKLRRTKSIMYSPVKGPKMIARVEAKGK